MKISKLLADMRNVDIRFRVIKKGEPREISSADGKELQLAEVEKCWMKEILARLKMDS
ncbi:MAG: hypothetical protein ACTSPM_09640 [Candidatus Heimdallarchaeota archaeon]